MHKTKLAYTEHQMTSYQKDIWLEQCLYPGKPIYNLGGYIEIKGKIDKDILNKAINALIEQNDSLRMRVMVKNGAPCLKILSEVTSEINFYDFSDRENPYQFCRSWMEKAFLEYFRAGGALNQFALLKADDNMYFWFVKTHHITIDGFGLSILFKQTIENYNYLVKGAIAPVRPNASYTEFIAENQKYLESQAFLNDREFWQEKYRSIPEALFNRSSNNGAATDGTMVSDRITFFVKRSIFDKVIAFSEENGCSAFHYILAVLYTYFSRVCNKEELVIGVPTLNRGKAKYKEVIGLFTNVLPVRINPGKTISFKELMVMIKGELMECYRHQKFPLGEIYRTAFTQAKEKSNIFDISLSYVNGDFSVNYATADSHNVVSLSHQHERNALTIFVRESNAARDISIDFDYQIGVFEKFIPIENLVGHFQHLLGEALQNGDTDISKIEFISQEEKHELLYRFNDTKAGYPKEKTIQTMFEELAARTPAHLAVVFGKKRLTYGELNSRANQLAKKLRAKGVKPDNIIGIMTERSIVTVVSVLGVLKAGGAYLPIDPNYPADRIKYMLEDSLSNILLTQGHLRDMVAYQGSVIDVEDESLYEGDDKNPDNVNKPSDLAYVIYTSGSTGKPKGVMIEHRGIANLTTFCQESCRLGNEDRMLQFASNSFDASVWEMFTGLLTGATIYLVDRETINNLVEFEDFLEQNGITVTLLPPSYLAGMAPERITRLKHLFTGGSAITRGLVNRWKNNRIYRNAYGPTEATVIATVWDYDETELGNGPVPIGRPISNTAIYILDKNQRLLPIGAAGELCIGGDGLARGYLNRPELTEEKFTLNPNRNGARMYKTGDLARWRPDGKIEFLGRIDYQVKIRGFRIELGEIEARLLDYATVREAVVIARTDDQGDNYLTAYFVSDAQLEVDELRAHLLKELPDYMVPVYFVQLDSMPLTPNDKIDRKALPVPQRGREPGSVYIAPRNEQEAILAKVWQEVLNVERIGIQDNFFNLGGDSIKAIQVLSRLNAYKLKLEMRELLSHPVIEELSGFIKQAAQTAEQGIIEGKVWPTPIQRWLFAQDFAEKHHFNQAVMLYRQEGFEKDLLESVLAKLVEQHDALRMVVKREKDGETLFIRGLGKQLYSLEVVAIAADDNFQEIAAGETARLQGSLDLENGPLLKAVLFKTADGDYLFFLIHHLVVDGISWRIILQDLFYGYTKAANKQPITFAAKTDAFQAWSEQLSRFANSRELLNEVDYWAAVEAKHVKALPKDREITKRRYGDTEQLRLELALEDTAKLLREVNQAYNTEINDILLTALGLAVREWTGEDQVLVNLEGHGREEIIKDIDVSRTVGWFTAQYPVLLNLEGDYGLAYRIKAVKENMRQIPNRGIGYGILKYLTLPENRETLQFNLKPEISFNYLGQFDAILEHGLFSLADIPAGTSISPNMEWPYAIDINCMVIAGRLTLNFTYHQAEYNRTTIVKIAECFQEKLVQIIAHCTTIDSIELTPSDFTYKNLTLDELETVLSKLSTRNIKDLYVLSPMQEGLLYHAMKDRTSVAYFEQVLLSIAGELNLTQVKESFQQLIDRYDIFRTVFVSEAAGKPLQIVMKEQRADVEVVNIAHLAPAKQQAFIDAFLEQDKIKGFDLQKDRLIRLRVIVTGNAACKLLWSFHHIIMDGWCLGITLRDFFSIYVARQENRPPELGEAYPYSDYIKWLARQKGETAAAYWEEYLRGFEEQTSLPKKDGLPAEKNYQRTELIFRLDAETSCGLGELARKNNVTLGTVIQTLWGLLLARYNNTADVVFGTVVSGRSHEIKGVETMVGLFINTMPVRVKCDGKHSFRQLLQAMQQALVESERYSYYPLAEIQARTSVKDGLIDHIVVFENYPMETVLSGDYGVDIKVNEVFEQTNYDFNVVVIPGRELTIKFIYNALVYDGKFIDKIKEHLRLTASAVLASPGMLLQDINILTEEEEDELLYTFNNTKTDYPKNKTVAELLEEQAAKTPDNIAVASKERLLSYRELNAKANQLACLLRAKGVKPNSVVGIMAERSPELIIGLAGILKAGGAYLPIDPEYPGDRIAYMLEDSEARILLTNQSLAEKTVFAGEIFYLEDENLYSGDITNPIPEHKAEDLAYVIYTSGSTGKPKGVEIEHRSLVNLVFWHKRIYSITAEDRATLVAGQAFDASVWETWPYLVSGAGLYIPEAEARASTTKLIDWLKDNLITISFMPTPLAEVLLAEAWDSDIALRAMLTGGDKLHRRPAKELPFSLINHYGPTESTVVASWGIVLADEAEERLPSIGRPMDNTQIYIVDRNDQLQPVGVAGELCVAGDGLARGYLNRPELTAEKFVPNPFTPGTRMYRTGDLARWLPDGHIEFLGRLDHQVKIRGFRIELGEIENQLLKHPLVKEAVVIAWDDRHKNKSLAAYLSSTCELTVDELQGHLLQELPEYMVPQYFISLDKMPLTPNGKIDRKALPEPEWRGNAGDGYVAPRNEVDERIQKVWQEVLGCERIGIDDDFFQLGGNSIKAIQVATKLALDFEVGINDIFQYQTIRALSDTVKYSEGRLKAMLVAMNEAAATRTASRGFDSRLRRTLHEYRAKNKAYKQIDYSAAMPFKNILLVGGTGYLGIHILYQLLKNTDYTVYVPVRGKDAGEARDRLAAKLKFYFRFNPNDSAAMEKRIQVLNGDITQEFLGLAPEKYAELAEQIDCIINSAAKVKHYGHYSEFDEVNVKGNQRLIDFAGSGKKKAYNFISTTSVGNGEVDGKDWLVFTEYDCEVGQKSNNYYVETKLAAEKSILKAREAGLDANIFRVGNLVFDSSSGIFQENIADNAFYNLIKSLIKLGCFPGIREKTVNFSFIDSVAKAVVLLFDKKNLQKETYHLFNPRQVNMILLAGLIKQAGLNVRTIPINDFIQYLYSRYEDQAIKNEITRILVHSNVFFEGASKTSFIIRNQKTESILRALNFTWPELDERKIHLMLEHCKQVGFI